MSDAAPGDGATPLLRGVVAIGDSITNGRGEPWRGVPAQSWAQWVAEALELPFTKLACDGARTAELLREQAPRLRGPYDLACLYAGVNDARALDWDADAFARDLDALAAAAGAAAERVLICTLPADLGRPSCAPKAAQASEIVREVAARRGRLVREVAARRGGLVREVAAGRGALVVALDDLGGRRFVLPDAVHPNAVGQVEIAARALAVLAADGLLPRHDVWQLADRHRSRRTALAADRRWLALLARDLRRRGVERLLPRLRR